MEVVPLQTHMLISAVEHICHKLYGIEIFLPDDLIWCARIIISIINGDLTAKCSRPIKLIELSSFCHDQTKKHNFKVTK